MKKLVKSLIISASVAAIAGIGAVSFAAWQSNGYTTATANPNTTGSVSIVGFAGETVTGVQDLMPWDQQDEGVTTIAKYTLPKVTSSVGYTIAVDMEGVNGWSGSLYVIINDKETGITASDPEVEANGWKAIGTDSVFTFDATGDAGQQLYAYVILDSSALDDMNKSYSLTFTLAEVSGQD